MIEILPERNADLLKGFYAEKNLLQGNDSMAVIARFGQEILGYCLFELSEAKLTVLALEPQNDIMLADGILRSALHVGVENQVMDAYYSDSAPEPIFKKLGFIGDEPKSLRVEKLFQSCGGCGK